MSKTVFKPNLLIGRSYQLFLDGIRTEDTRKVYVRWLEKYAEFHQANTETLIADTPENATEKVRTHLRFLKERVESKEMQPATVMVRFAAIKLFYTMNDVILNWKKLAKMLPPMTKLEDRGYTKEEILKMLEHPDEREKVIVLLLATTGMRVGGIPDIKLKHITPFEIDGKLVSARIAVYASAREEYFTYCTAECYRAIMAYIDYRKRNHERVHPDSWVIRDTMNTEAPSDIVKLVQGMRLNVHTIQTILERLTCKCGVRVKGNVKRHPVKLAHGFRKFYNTTCKDNGMDVLHKKMLMGWGAGLEDNYYRPTEDKLVQSYLQVADALTFNDAEVLRLENLRLKEELCRHDEAFTEGVNQMKKMMEGLDVETLKKMVERQKALESAGKSLSAS